jgi:hypothetical protein
MSMSNNFYPKEAIMRLSLIILVVGLSVCAGVAQYPTNPNNPPIQCDGSGERDPFSSLDEIEGTAKILWIIAAADSHALPQEWPVHERGDDCGPYRIMYPSTYRMPSWANRMFDSTDARSFTRFYKDQSSDRFRVLGAVVGKNDSTIFTCDPDTAVRPRKCGTSFHGGRNFFLNIMEKVDSVVNFADYLPIPNSIDVPWTLFNIYGHSENCQFEGGGVNSLAASYFSHDTNSAGQRIYIRHGVTFWSASEQALSEHDPCPWVGATDSVALAYWGAIGVGSHEYGHGLGFSHTFCNGCSGWQYGGYPEAHVGCGSFDVMGYEPGWPDPDNDWAGGAPSVYNPIYRLSAGWITPLM